MQGLPAFGQTQPGSTLHLVVKSAALATLVLQPSLSTMLPSSQSSSGVRTPLPHTSCRHFTPAVGQTQLLSTVQVLLQPSPATVLSPSSHCSPGSSAPSPQTATLTFTQGLPGWLHR